MHGKIISKSFQPTDKGEAMVNRQVVVGRRIGRVIAYWPQTDKYQVKFLDNNTPLENYHSFEQLFGLVVQYRAALSTPKRSGHVVATAELKIMPLKNSQWQQAITHKEVDNQKQVHFELKDILTMKGELIMAKIIPIRPQYYSPEDIRLLIEETATLCAQFGFEHDIPEAAQAIKELKARYVE